MPSCDEIAYISGIYMGERPLTVAWISYFPVSWLPDLPEPLRAVARLHPATWQRVLLEELIGNPSVKLHVLSLQKHFPRDYTFDREGVSFHCLKASLKLRVGSLFWWDTLLIGRRLRRIRPDLVHAWGFERGAGVVASRLKYPFLVTIQGLLNWYLQQVDLGPFVRLEARLERVTLRRASVVTTESRFAVNWLREHYPHLDIHQAEHAPNWLFHRLARQPKTNPTQFLFIGPMSLLKGTDLLLKALDGLKKEVQFQLTIVGSSAEEFVGTMRKVTSAALWERVRILHGLTTAEIAGLLGQSTIMLFPTRADTSPNSVKEAVVAGVPVVASAVGGIVDYVVPGKNGLTFAAGDLDAFTHAIKSALAHPLFRHGRVDPEALEQMRAYLSPKAMALEFLRAYDALSKQNRAN